MGLGTGVTAAGFGEFAPFAARAGGYLGQRVKDITGFGAYSVRSNVLYEGATVPYVRNKSATNGNIISHKEYIGDIITSSVAGDFKIESFPINPGLSETFEWLAQIACNYSEYVLEGCLFMFRSMSADALNSTNTALGTVIMATQYNSYEPIFTSKAEMESYEYAMSGRPSEDMIHPIECDPHQSVMTQLFTRTADVPQGDLRMYDIGKFSIATTGFQAADVNIGELWVTYQVCLVKPKLYAALGYFNEWFHSYSEDPDTSHIFGTTFTLGTTNNMTLGMDYFSPLNCRFSLPKYPQPVSYQFTILWQNAGSTATASMTSTLSNFVNCRVLTGYTGVANQDAPRTGVNCNKDMALFFVKTEGANFIPTFDITISGMTYANCHVFATQIPGIEG